jgi:hypothetical protein
MSATVLVCGNIFDGSSEELSGPPPMDDATRDNFAPP